jgi:hypothetical protein
MADHFTKFLSRNVIYNASKEMAWRPTVVTNICDWTTLELAHGKHPIG